MKQLITVKVASAVIAAMGLTVGAVGVVGAATGTIGTTGDDSENHVTATSDTNHSVYADVENNNEQDATTGHATIEGNDDTAGSAGTGAAENGNTQEVTGGVEFGDAEGEESAVGGASAAITGPTGDDSSNSAVAHSDYETRTRVDIENNSSQSATSGNATVSGNENGGSATTGAASNESTQTVGFNVRY
jgi:hypothetical protein